MVATLGEVTSECTLRKLCQYMKQSEEGKRILDERPIIHSSKIDWPFLNNLPDASFGKAYVRFLKKHQISPDTRTSVQFISDPELAYVMTRY
jgi:ubiquinone biosynthesis protein COQ4